MRGAVLALASGAACAAAFPSVVAHGVHDGVGAAVGVVSLALLFCLPRLLKPKGAMLWGFVAAFLGRLATLWWVTGVSAAGWVVLSAACAVFVLPAIRYASVHAPTTSSHGPFRWVWQTALLYTAGEALLAYVVGGFPWNRMAAAAASWRSLAQLAEFGGEPLLTGWMALAGTALAALAVGAGHPFRRRAAALGVLAALALAAGGGAWRLAQVERALAAPDYAAETLRVAMVQLAIPQPDKWSAAKVEMIYERIDRLTREAVGDEAFAPELVIWPEAALPDETLSSDRSIAFVKRMQALPPAAGGSAASLLTGSLDIVWRLSSDQDDHDYTNAALLFGEGMKEPVALLGNYAKRKLVIVGEYTPLLCLLPTRIQERLAIRFGLPLSITAGTSTGRFRLPRKEWFFSPLICFEDIFPGLARDDVAAGAMFLVTLTNDAWFDEVCCPAQHALNASLRTIETRRPLLRCANTGWTCQIDPAGRFVDLLESPDSFSEGVLRVEVPIAANPPRTLFVRFGYLLDPALAAFAVGQLLVLWTRRWLQRRKRLATA